VKVIASAALAAFLLLSCAVFAQGGLPAITGAAVAFAQDETPFPTPSPTPIEPATPTPSPAPPGCAPGSDPTKPCTVIMWPLEQLSQRVANLEGGQKAIVDWINTQQRRLEAEAAAKTAAAPKKK
jgi:hypothetical protein